MGESEMNVIPAETSEQRDTRMAWWREARFGMFIHWGLYSVVAGDWKGQPVRGLSSWTLHEVKSPLEAYTPLMQRFDPVRFNADAWVRLAKSVGMKYIIITTKHHEGFCLFESKHSDFDIMSSPFQRDIMKELVDACRREGLRIGWYYSILDWHHPDYVPRRPGDARSVDGVEYERCVEYLHDQVRELLTNYGPIDVMWFDGEWDDTWTHRHGSEMYALVRELQPNIIVNNRVDKGRVGMAGMTKEGGFVGDFGTPEQELPATGLPGVDWETCMTMNDTWGYKKNDTNWKSATTLIRMLVDAASKGGNFLLNVGPTALGEIPEASVERLEAIGQWMKVNAESICDTLASPFEALPWGRCTQRASGEDKTRLYLHVFEWPIGGTLQLPGLRNDVAEAYLLSDSAHTPLPVNRGNGTIQIELPGTAPDSADSVIVMDIRGTPRIDNVR